MDWIFTFCIGGPLAHRCVRLHGTWEEARQQMFDMFGSAWAFQYGYEDWLGIQRSMRAHGFIGETEVSLEEAIRIFKEA